MATKFLKHFEPQTKGILAKGKWFIWDVDRVGMPTHGKIEAEVNGKKVGDIQATMGKFSGMLRVRHPGMGYKEAFREFVDVSLFRPDAFDLEIELNDGKHSIGNLDDWMESSVRSNPPNKKKIAKIANAAWNKALDQYDCELGGKCSEASRILADDLQAAGYKPTLVAGLFRVSPKGKFNEPHTWVEVAGMIVDITASQFGLEFPDVWVDADPIHYASSYRYFHENPGLEAEAERILRRLAK